MFEKIALLSVYDKSGLEPFAKKLVGLKFKILSTGKTAAFLRQHGIEVTDVSDFTGFPEILEGRIKSLHPKVHAGILARRNVTEDRKAMCDLKIPFIDLVVVNLYPFESKPGIEMIDVGGPTMLRAAAKNFEHVTVVCDTTDYDEALSVIARRSPKANDEAISLSFRKRMAAKVFAVTARYDAAIADFFDLRKTSLRYGENPHQKAFFELESGKKPLWEKPIQGKELSYNNVLDADAAWWLIRELKGELFACAVIKHTNPCGVACSKKSLLDAFEKAYACDTTSAFGGIVAFNREVDKNTAEALSKIFLEIILAPGFSKEALDILRAKKNLRLLISCETAGPDQTVRSAGGGLLVQDSDTAMESAKTWQIKTKREPTQKEMKAMALAWKVAKHVKSNAIVFASTDRVLAIGGGQTSRIDAVKLAARKLNDSRSTIHACPPVVWRDPRVVASDAFFPFPDNISAIAKTKATAIIQPGGSVKDAEVIAAADQYHLAMVFTGVRHFKH